MGCTGFQEGLVIAFVVALLFGVRRLPQIGEAIGRSIKTFKSGMRDDEVDVTDRARLDPGDDDVNT